MGNAGDGLRQPRPTWRGAGQRVLILPPLIAMTMGTTTLAEAVFDEVSERKTAASTCASRLRPAIGQRSTAANTTGPSASP